MGGTIKNLPGAFALSQKMQQDKVNKAMTDIGGIDPWANKRARDAALAQAPGAAPDITDPTLHVAAESQAQALLSKRGRKSTFLGSATLDASAPPKSLLGG